MAKQERAEQTRQRLIEAAAAEFAEHGYAGTSLHRIVGSAGVTMGALTFHFSSKSALADAVQRAGADDTRAALHRAERTLGAQGLLDEVRALADGLRTRHSIRAAARLARERQATGPGWYGSWAPGLREALERAWREERPEGGPVPPMVGALLCHVLLGLENAIAVPDVLRTITGEEPEESLAHALSAVEALLAPRA
ncbi:TetR/AcrR family transcriptional regulator [Streptomyces sp. NRRL F-5126]|uniref:TetR/AcrR family transcriptional regulator n=1 Tax=Streptomyces sp. NRRL F-5126 TaxID=1463857 RepID=UPI0006911950|nr:TetR/AcrR family transcriptional regulator [Streptomyces sp. NRRL F-5126]